jgi:pectinesterase
MNGTMKSFVIAASAGLFFLSQCPAQTKGALVSVTNPARVVRRSETVEVPLRDLIPLLGEIAGGDIVVTGNGVPILSQVTEGELLFQSDFAPLERKEFTVRRESTGVASGAPDGAPHFTTFVDGRYVLPREDYAWENDRIAFRMYGPALAAEVNNGIDVWTKRVRSLIVAKWYKEAEGAPAGQDPYHHDRGEGADFFDVGRSLGAGGCALWHEGRIHQPGVFSGWKTLANGPLRTEFELTYHGVAVGGRTITERKRISLDAGENLNRVRVTYDAPRPGHEVLVACGLVKRARTLPSSDTSRCWMGLWGPTNSDPVNGSLGTGVVFPPSAFMQFTEDLSQYLVIGRGVTGEPLTYYAGAGWTRSGDFASGKEWISYLDRCAVRIAAPLRVACAPLE